MTAIVSNPIFAKLHENRGLLFPVALICLLLVILIPLPPSILDLLLICNITLSVIVLVTTVYVQSPL
ncbi:MAG: EscV/YscV/HrcV family type secretion system export apparatus protein, partial [Phycisphaerales bacterium]|nr:EscV/YscV/HrcV family type secretion system export apparatus protein [Phycisphaerales bacterium]